MGLFDFLKSKPKPISDFQSNSEEEILYYKLKKETDKIRQENYEWQKEFNDSMLLRQKAQKYEKENNLNEAIVTYLQAIEQGETNEKLNINNYAHDIDRVIILYGKTKQKELLTVFLEQKINMYPNFQEMKKWAVRLSKLKSNKQIKTEPEKSRKIFLQKENRTTLGKQIEKFKKEMPEFNFYYDMQEDSDTLAYNNNVPFERFKKLREHREAFDTIKSLAKIAENEGDYKKAIETYEKLILEEYEGTEPYERLIIIFSKLKLKEDEKRAIEQAIQFFTQLKEKQLNYVVSLAEKYGMEKKAFEYINQDKKIFYYGGAFELYNPQTARLKKWNERLRKLNVKTK